METLDPFPDEPIVEHVINVAGAIVVTTSQGVDVSLPGIPTVHGSTVTEACNAALAALTAAEKK